MSINSEASAFQFRRQGRTDTFVAAQGAGAAPGGPPAKNTHEARTLDLAELERLKEGLDQQVTEMRKLYSKDENLDLSDEEGDADVNAQIQQLRRLIESNRALLAGEGGDDSDIASAESQGESDGEEKVDASLAQKQKEEDALKEALRKREEAAAGKASNERDAVTEQVLGAFADEADRMQEKLKRSGSFSEVDAQKIMADIGASCEAMGRVLDGDKAR